MGRGFVVTKGLHGLAWVESEARIGSTLLFLQSTVDILFCKLRLLYKRRVGS